MGLQLGAYLVAGGEVSVQLNLPRDSAPALCTSPGATCTRVPETLAPACHLDCNARERLNRSQPHLDGTCAPWEAF